jgi:hypothetical protein
MVGVSASALTLALGFCSGPEPALDPDYGKSTVDTSPESSDGRYHECGLVTEDGVTEYIDTYIERCGDTTLAGDYDLPATG